MYELINPKLYLSIFALGIFIWLFFRGIRRKVPITMMLFVVSAIVALSFTIVDTILIIIGNRPEVFHSISTGIQFVSGIIILFSGLYVGFLYGGRSGQFWGKFAIAILLLSGIAYVIIKLLK